MRHKCDILSLLLVASIFFTSAQTEGREFTDVQGRKLEGDLISVSGAQATIRRTSDAKVFTVTMSQFSPEDQAYMNEFASTSTHYNFDVKLVKDKQGTTKTKQNNVTYSAEQWVYKVALTNRSTVDADDLRVDYWLFLKADDGKIKAGPRVQQAGSSTIGALKRSAVHQFQTKPVTLSKAELDGGFYYESGAKNRARDSLGGVAVRVFRADKEVFSWATEPELLKTAVGKTEASETNALSQ